MARPALRSPSATPSAPEGKTLRSLLATRLDRLRSGARRLFPDRPDGGPGEAAAAASTVWLWLVVAAWYVQACVFLLVALDADAISTGGNLVGGSVVGAHFFSPWGVAAGVLGLLTLLGCVLLLLGQGFALRALFAIGFLGSLGLALLGSWGALVVPGAMAAAFVLLLATPALDLLEQRSGVASMPGGVR